MQKLKNCAKFKYKNASINDLVLVVLLKAYETYYSNLHGEELKV